MRLYPVNDISEGMVLGKSIYHSNNILLLGAGYRITHGIKNKLLERKYTHVYIMEAGAEDVIPEDIISDEIRLQAQSKLRDKIEKIQESLEFKDLSHEKVVNLIENGYLEKIDISYDLRKTVKEMLSDISSSGAKYLNTLMVKSKDNYFIDHSINTTVLAIVIGRSYHFSKTELISLALGTFLHDIGKIIIEQLKKGNESKGDKYLYKEHPTFGYLLLQNDNQITPMESQIVNQHHEFQDGSGFPIGLTGQNFSPLKNISRETKGRIFRLAEICSVANAYDNMVMSPIGAEMLSPDEVIKSILLKTGDKFNRDIVETLCKVIVVFPVGSYVRIVNIIDSSLIGYYGVVSKINEDNLSKPVIIITANKFRKRIKPIILDTSKLKKIDLKLIV